jgi:2-keto-4-pentenoate hydratase/2-oxohepta-3-ene-1,7-dioic acid hydratase in catechol pathway
MNAVQLFRLGSPRKEQIGLQIGSDAWDASSTGLEYDESFFASGGLKRLEEAFSRDGKSWPLVDTANVRLGSPIARPSKIIGVGLNYKAHAEETGAEVPAEPKIFMKATTAMCGVNDALVLPKGSTQTDYEVELALVIGHKANYVSPAEALDYVAGYMVCNDYSERDFQKNRSGQFVKGKSADTFAPLGPFLVVRSDLDFSDVRLWCSVNGEMRQDSRTSDMVFSVPQLVSSISQYMTLLPGDVITTGTPPGVGLGMKPPRFLKPGDVVEYGVEGIGSGRQTVVAYEHDSRV